MQYPTRNGAEVRGPLTPAWINQYSEIRYYLPVSGESCVYMGTKIQCEEYLAEAYHAAMEATVKASDIPEEGYTAEYKGIRGHYTLDGDRYIGIARVGVDLISFQPFIGEDIQIAFEASVNDYLGWSGVEESLPKPGLLPIDPECLCDRSRRLLMERFPCTHFYAYDPAKHSIQNLSFGSAFAIPNGFGSYDTEWYGVHNGSIQWVEGWDISKVVYDYLLEYNTKYNTNYQPV